jgi:hypothetical protein
MKPVTSDSDRRRICRYPVVTPDALLGWREEPNFKNTPARLVNLSLNGCMVELLQRPGVTAQQSVWVYPHEISGAGWTEGRIVEVSKPLFGKCRVRIAFLAPLAYEPFKRLIYGLDQPGELPEEELPEHERDHFWR